MAIPITKHHLLFIAVVVIGGGRNVVDLHRWFYYSETIRTEYPTYFTELRLG